MQAGNLITLQLPGFAPGSPVSFHIESRPESLAVAHADASGMATRGVIIREEMPLGTHELVATGIDPQGQPHEVRRGTTAVRGLRWWWWWWPAAGSAAGLLLAGIGAGGG